MKNNETGSGCSRKRSGIVSRKGRPEAGIANTPSEKTIFINLDFLNE